MRSRAAGAELRGFIAKTGASVSCASAQHVPGISSDYALHFDLYTYGEYVKSNGNTAEVAVSAPYSHDAQ